MVIVIVAVVVEVVVVVVLVLSEVVISSLVVLNILVKQNDQLLIKHVLSCLLLLKTWYRLNISWVDRQQLKLQQLRADTEMFGSLLEQPSASNTINKALSACVSSSQECCFAFTAVTSALVHVTVDQVHLASSILSTVCHYSLDCAQHRDTSFCR